MKKEIKEGRLQKIKNIKIEGKSVK